LRRFRKPNLRLVPRLREAVHRIGRRMPWYTPANTTEDRNIRNLYTETLWFGVLNGLVMTFVSVFALRLGATTNQMGWLAALPALVNVVWLIPAARIIERQRRRLPIMVVTGVLQRMGYLVMAAMPFAIATGRVAALIVINTLIMLPTGVINTAVTSIIPDLTTPERRGHVVRVRWLVLSAVATAAALLGGWFLELLPPPLNYQVLLGLGAAFSLFGMRYLRRIREPGFVSARRSDEPGRRYSLRRLLQSLIGVTSHRKFVRFSVTTFAFYAGLYLPGALWPILRVRVLGASDAWIGIIAVTVNVSTIIGYIFWDKVSARRGDRWLLRVTAFGMAAYALLTAFVPTIGWMIPTSILGGLAWSGCNLALFRILLEVCPQERRPTYVALYTALLNIAAFGAPLLGTALSGWIGIHQAFVVAGALRGVAALLFVWLVR
jgi:MFS family permease